MKERESPATCRSSKGHPDMGVPPFLRSIPLAELGTPQQPAWLAQPPAAADLRWELDRLGGQATTPSRKKRKGRRGKSPERRPEEPRAWEKAGSAVRPQKQRLRSRRSGDGGSIQTGTAAFRLGLSAVVDAALAGPGLEGARRQRRKRRRGAGPARGTARRTGGPFGAGVGRRWILFVFAKPPRPATGSCSFWSTPRVREVPVAVGGR